MPAIDLTLTDEQRQIAVAVEELLASVSDSAAVRRAAFAGDGFDRALWRHVAEIGACGIHLPESHGGLGLGVTELVLAAEAFGRRLACVPWFESTALVGSALAVARNEQALARWVPALARGETVATMDIDLLGELPVRATRESDFGSPGDGSGGEPASRWRLDGLLPAVPAAAAADHLLLRAVSDEGTLLAMLPLDAPGVRRRPRPTHDRTRPVAEVTLEGVEVRDADLLARGDAAARVIELVTQLAAVVLAAEQVGVAQRCLDLSVDHLQQRVQFGRPLATFQALKHRCAQMMATVELARSAVLGAARVIDVGPDAPTLLRVAAMARCQADEAAQFCTQEAIQLHGGVGFTWDYDPQLYFKRAQAARCWLGTPAAWRERVAATLLDGGPA